MEVNGFVEGLEYNFTTTSNSIMQNQQNSNPTFSYCGAYLKAFGKSYSAFHGYGSLIVCLLGAHANIFNLIVLTRKEMRSPTNAILTGLAVADLANMLEYIPYSIYRILPKSNSYGWALYVLVHSNFSQVCHTTSIWLAVTLAIWRYVVVTRYRDAKRICSMPRAILAVAAAYVFSAVLCTPIYFSFAVRLVQKVVESNSSQLSALNGMIYDNNTASPQTLHGESQVEEYAVNLSDLALKYSFLKIINFWLYR